MSFHRQLLLWFLGLSLIPVFVVGTYMTISANRLLLQGSLRQIDSIASIQKDRVETMLHTYANATRLLSSSNDFKRTLKGITTSRDSDRNLFALKSFLEASQDSIGKILIDATLFDSNGDYIVSVASRPLPTELLDRLKILRQKDLVILGFTPFEDSFLIHYSTPLYLDDVYIGNVVSSFSGNPFLKITDNYSGLGSTGETTFGASFDLQKMYSLTRLRFSDGSLLKVRELTPNSNMNIHRAVMGYEGIDAHGVDYRGKEVLTSMRNLDLYGAKFGIATKIDSDEVYAPIERLEHVLYIILVLMTVFVSVLAYVCYSFTLREMMNPKYLKSEGRKIDSFFRRLGF